MPPSSKTTVVGAGLPWSGRIDRGEHLVLVDPEGQQAIDFLCYNAHDPHERYHAPNTVKLQGQHLPRAGPSVLWSVRARKMMTIVEDTCGGHDTLFGCCSFELDDVRYGQRNPRACQQNFESELARHGLDATSSASAAGSSLPAPRHIPFGRRRSLAEEVLLQIAFKEAACLRVGNLEAGSR